MNILLFLVINTIIFIIIFKITKYLTNNKLSNKKYLFIITFIISTIFTIYVNQDNNYIISSLIINTLLTTILNIYTSKYKIPYTIKIKDLIFYLIIALSMSSLLELTIFNCRHFESLSFKEIIPEIEIKDNNVEQNQNNTYKSLLSNYYTFETKEINEKVKNIYIYIRDLALNNEIVSEEYFINRTNELKSITIKVSDDNSDYLYNMPSYNFHKEVPLTQIHRLHLSGNCKRIAFSTYIENNHNYEIKIILNTRVPYHLELLRIIFLTIIIMLVIIFHPKSSIYKIETIDIKNSKYAIVSTIIFNLCLFILLVSFNSYFFKGQFKHIIIIILFLITLITSSYLLYQIIKKWYKSTSVGIYSIIVTLFIISSNILYLIEFPNQYNLISLYSFALTLIGLSLWITSYEEEKLNYLKSIIGSISIVLSTIFQPIFIINYLFFIPIFYEYFFNTKMTDKKKKELLLFIIPLFITIPIFINNYIHYDSILINNQNSKNILTPDQRVISINRLYKGFYYYLISPMYCYPKFPYFINHFITSNHLGQLITEEVYSGFLMTNLICTLSLFTIKFKKYYKNKIVYKISLLSTILAIIVILFNTLYLGISYNQCINFSYLLLIPTILTILSLNNKYNNSYKFKKIIFILLLFTIIINLNLHFANQNCIKIVNPKVYETVNYLINFMR